MKVSNKAKAILRRAKNTGFLNGLDFSLLMQELLISKDGHVITTGGYQNVNAEVALRLIERIKRHPVMWSWFMVG